LTHIIPIEIADWSPSLTHEQQVWALHHIENGDVLYFPRLNFTLANDEQPLLSPALLSGKRKNISLDPRRPQLQGNSSEEDADARCIHGMMERFATQAHELLRQLLPNYGAHLLPGRTSFRPMEISGRSGSWHKDDTRLHVDSFPATPVQDKRILRVFSNINPGGKPRAWRIGEAFEQMATRFLPAIAPPLPGSSHFLRALRLTKSRRSAYDHYMLHLHDGMKRNKEYQQQVPQTTFDFPAQSTWMMFTDQVSHAAMAGQHLLEQTFYLPVTAMQKPAQSPLRILEKLTARPLA
jgi:hypothetical protein